ncbi:hypothetical protein HG535_0D00890 [Zygotorulaspora mrakii]|uniref:GATA-type domain-containing protein n=1 Tax=Zygotorulaspora mrakii TaxID=42260 RepID=A0A7H9B177_ZYGMR|nr:uncharacterized protein HG535_0D00890 [Zygotorulaspora mrakii]QLG72381.1 hypothetical protein HG535_0D00890 [Zygotorulaspora mrakii]
MCATKMSCVRIQEMSASNMENNHSAEKEARGKGVRKFKGLDTSGRSTSNRQSLLRRSDRSSERDAERDARTISVPNLLNLGNEQRVTRVGDAAIKGGESGTHAGEDVLRVPQEYTENSFVVSSMSQSAYQAARAQRKSSVDSLMRAAVTVERNDQDLRKMHQNQINSIIDFKNQISDEIQSWPNTGHTSQENAIRSSTEAMKDFTFTDMSSENLDSLKHVANTLHATVKQLDELKRQQRPNEDFNRQRIRLPSIDMMTSNIGSNPQAGLRNYQFPNDEFNRNPRPSNRHLESQFIASSSASSSSSIHQPVTSYVQAHPHNSGNYVSFTGPMTNVSPRINHRATISDPSSAYRSSMMKERQNSATCSNWPLLPFYPLAPSSSSSSSSCPIVFQPPYSSNDSSADSSRQNAAENSIGKRKLESKDQKINMRTQRSSSENSVFQNRQALAHGLLMAENIKRNQQSTTSCIHCGEASTPEWRRGPYGNRTLCNACGLFYRKLVKRFGNKDTNMFMRYRKSTNPEDRRVPSIAEVPKSIQQELDNDKNLDGEYFTIGGTNANFIFSENKK